METKLRDYRTLSWHRFIVHSDYRIEELHEGAFLIANPCYAKSNSAAAYDDKNVRALYDPEDDLRVLLYDLLDLTNIAFSSASKPLTFAVFYVYSPIFNRCVRDTHVRIPYDSAMDPSYWETFMNTNQRYEKVLIHSFS